MREVRKTSVLSLLIIISIALFAVLLPATASASKTPKVDPRYKQWFERDVAYIITKEEKGAFLNLSTDAERDQFIEHFWAIRNPNPGAPTNEYRDEIYRRIAYSNQYFGTPGGTNGWNTDRGRAYITLGAPKQRAPYFQAQQTKPMEIWFYENVNPALPPYFYLIFYQRDIGDEYRLYSPYFDGPDKLTTSVNAVNDRRKALDLIDRELGREVARTTLSLVPDEPVDMDRATSSMESDLMLAVFKNLANHPLTKDALKRKSEMLESVSHRTILDEGILQVMTVPLRDVAGNMNLHYVLRLPRASDFTVAESDKGRYYNVTARVRVYGPDTKLIFTQEDNPTKYLTDQEFARIKSRPFGYEGWLPLTAGKYKIEFTLTNNLSKIGYRAEREVTVPGVAKDGLQISSLVPFSDAEETLPGKTNLPFSMAGFKFTPKMGGDLDLVPGQDLKFFYQLWITPEEKAALQGRKLQVEYGYGRPGGRGESKTIKEELGAEQFDSFGSLGSGKLIPLKDSPAGSYHLALTVIEPSKLKKIYGALNFRITPTSEAGVPWDVVDEQISKRVADGSVDYQRALSCAAQGNEACATQWLQGAIQKNEGNEAARAELATLYYDKHDFKRVANLYRGKLSDQTKEASVLLVGDSIAKTGDTKGAIDWLESALKMKKESKPLYLALASYYEQAGNLQRAKELKKDSESITPQ